MRSIGQIDAPIVASTGSTRRSAGAPLRACTAAGSLQLVDPLVLDGGGKSHEHALYVAARQSTGLEELDAILVRQHPSLVGRYYPIGIEVGLVPAEDNVAVRRGSGLDVAHPPNDMVEARPVGYVVAKDEPVGSAEEVGG